MLARGRQIEDQRPLKEGEHQERVGRSLFVQNLGAVMWCLLIFLDDFYVWNHDHNCLQLFPSHSHVPALLFCGRFQEGWMYFVLAYQAWNRKKSGFFVLGL